MIGDGERDKGLMGKKQVVAHDTVRSKFWLEQIRRPVCPVAKLTEYRFRSKLAPQLK